MPLTPRSSPQICTHERGVGTTVCLHCRKEARVAAKDRRRRLVLRGSAAGIVVATGVAATALGATAIRDKGFLKHEASATPAVPPEPARPASDSNRVGSNAVQAADSTTGAPMQPPAAAVASKPIVATPAAPAPIVRMGSSSIAGGLGAERTDSAVTLSFDMPMTRTRRPDKFEQLVRTTLPSIYGRRVDSALVAMPIGSLANQGDLLTELPSRGMRIPLDSAWEIRVFPETRKGVEGPLVVRYRASAVAR